MLDMWMCYVQIIKQGRNEVEMVDKNELQRGCNSKMQEDAMALPTISVDDREIILLSGYKFVYQEALREKKIANQTLIIMDEGELRRSAKSNFDAVAYGYVDGQWVVAA